MAKAKKNKMPVQVVNKTVQVDVSYKIPTQRTLLKASKMQTAPLIMDDKKTHHLCNVKKYL